MRYLVYFKDKTTAHVSEAIGKQIIKAKMEHLPGIILKGACISTDFINMVKPIKEGFFSRDFVERQAAIEQRSPDAIKFLASND